MSEIVALIGSPLKHSISPAFQQAAFDRMGLDVRYEKWETLPGELAGAVSRLRQPSVLGANVTIPCKESIIPLLDQMSETAARIGAVNTVLNRNGVLTGFNTDAEGFVTALLEDGGYRLRNRRAVVLGAGGAARAVVFGLLNQEVTSIGIFNRSLDRARQVVRSFARSAGRIPLAALPWEDRENSVTVQDCDFMVNCTSLGMKYGGEEGESPLAAASIPSRAMICDLVYNPVETPLLREARKAGAEVIGGLSMLVRQGAASFELWTGRKPAIDIMRQRAMEALE